MEWMLNYPQRRVNNSTWSPIFGPTHTLSMPSKLQTRFIAIYASIYCTHDWDTLNLVSIDPISFFLPLFLSLSSMPLLLLLVNWRTRLGSYNCIVENFLGWFIRHVIQDHIHLKSKGNHIWGMLVTCDEDWS